MSYKTVLYRLYETFGPSIWGKFQHAYRLRTGKTLSLTDEPDSLSASHFVEDRLYGLVRTTIEQDEITMSRGAEILRLDLNTMRDMISSWV